MLDTLVDVMELAQFETSMRDGPVADGSRKSRSPTRTRTDS
jgi:hypothetical protein